MESFEDVTERAFSIFEEKILEEMEIHEKWRMYLDE